MNDRSSLRSYPYASDLPSKHLLSMSERPYNPRAAVLRYVTLLCLLSIVGACGSGDAPPTDADATPPPAPASAEFPRLQPAQMQALVDSVDYIDYVFYELEFSMSMDNASGIQYALAQIGPESARRRPGCKPIGRVFYQIKGRNAMAADMFFSQGCTYFEFVEGNTVVAANEMSEVGKEFLNNQFGQIMGEGYQRVE